MSVVGSRANGTANASSDWDYVMGGSSKVRYQAAKELPRGWAGGELDGMGRETGIDIFNANKTPLDTSKPYITFTPGRQ